MHDDNVIEDLLYVFDALRFYKQVGHGYMYTVVDDEVVWHRIYIDIDGEIRTWWSMDDANRFHLKITDS